MLAVTVYNSKKWLRFTSPKTIAKAASVIQTKMQRGVELIAKPLYTAHFKLNSCIKFLFYKPLVQ